uniref:Uncharacterized protein n=1 Tax=Cyclophora tenuis TaxID=216820 RepID=A0A7S1GPD2_CYCTE
MASDYIPDHAMLPEELVFHVVMLGIAINGLIEAVLPVIQAKSTRTTIRDGRCYHKVFRKAGIPWLKYKVMAVQTFAWVQLDPGMPVASQLSNNSTEHLIWPYAGEVHVPTRHGIIVHKEGGLGHLLRDLEFARQIGVVDNNNNNNYKYNNYNYENDDANHSNSPPTTIRAGPQGATVLMIDTASLVRLMKTDQVLADGIRSVLFNGMQERINTLLSTNEEDQPTA